MPHARFATSMGWLLFLYGIIVVIGWLLHWPIWVHFDSGGVAMVLNTALCLTLGGLALALPSLRFKSVESVRIILGSVIVAIGAAALVESLFFVDLRLDLPALHRWFSDRNPFPGRMTPYTALAMVLAGISLALGSRKSAGSIGLALRRTLPAAAISVAVLGMSGQALEFNLAYRWYGFPLIPVPTGVAIVGLGLGLMFDSYGATDTHERQDSGEIRVYALLGVAMTLLVTVAVISYGSIIALPDRIRWVEDRYQVRAEFEAAMDTYDRARLGWRAFIRDNDPAGADEFQKAAVSLPPQIQQVVARTVDSPRQQARLEAMRHLIAMDLAVLQDGVPRRQQAGTVAAADILSTVKLNAPQLNALAAEFRAEESELMLARQMESQQSSRGSIAIIAAGTTGGFGLMFCALWILKQKHDRRGRSEQQLAGANAFLDSVLENIPNMIFVKDAEDLRFLRLNKAGESLLGLSREQLIGASDHDFFPELEADFFRVNDRAVLDGGRLVDIPEESISTRFGGIRILHTMKIPILDAKGAPRYLLGISEDITERKHAEDEIRTLNSTLKEQTDRLESANNELETFSYSVSHDLRTPLRAIDGFAQMLAEDYGERLDDEGLRYLNVIRRNVTRMDALIDDLLTLSRLGRVAIAIGAVDMNRLVDEVVRELLGACGEKKPQIDIGPLPAANADRALMYQVWVNLISNAIKYSSKSTAPTIEVRGHRGGMECVYSVKDNGVGFNMEYYAKLFGVFQRLHRAEEFSGTGVGLAIVQRLVARHGGRVWAHGEVNKGATFSFTVPTGEKGE